MAAINPVGNNIPYSNLINNASDKYQVPATLISAVIKQESGYQPNAHSGAGASGLMQLMPSTARSLGVTNVWDPAQSIDGGTKYLANAIKTNNGNISYALAAYNAGQGAVNKYGGIPPYTETKNYVSSILSMYGGGNLDPNNIAGGDGGGNPLNIGATIVNGFQKIFQTIVTDTTKFIIYLILFAVFVFFGYKALSASPVVNEGIQTTRRAGKAVTKTVKAGQQRRYAAKKEQYRQEVQKVKDRTPSDLKKAKRIETAKKIIKYMPK